MIYADDQCKSFGLSKEPWIWQKNCLVFDFQFHGLFPVAIDLYLTPSGWELQIFARKGGEAFLSRLFTETPHLKEYANAELTDKGRRVIHRWPVDADLTEIERSLLNVLLSLDKSARSLPQALEPTLPVTC
jgi:hypothetical protein